MIWIPAKLGDLLTLEYGKSLPRSSRDESGAVPVAGSNGSDGNHSVALVKGPGIVVGRKGSAGKVTWFDAGFWPIDTTYFVEHDPTVTDLRWLYYLLQSMDLTRLNKTTGVPGLNRNDAYAQSCWIPPLSEQQKIVELLDESDRLRKLRHDADVKADRILPALFLKMFGNPATNSKGLRKETLGKLIRLKSGDFLPAKSMAKDGKYPVYGGNGINGFHDEYMFEDSKVVLGRVGAYCGAVHYSDRNSWITDNALYVAEKLEPIEDQYLVAALEQAKLNQYAGRAGQPLISGSRIYPVEILVPAEVEQLAFARSVSDLRKVNDLLDEASRKLDFLWDTMMTRAFSGQLTTKWREGHMKELLAEMEQQARALNLPVQLEATP